MICNLNPKHTTMDPGGKIVNTNSFIKYCGNNFISIYFELSFVGKRNNLYILCISQWRNKLL